MDCRGRDYALFRVRTPVILSPRARLGTARVSAYGGQAGGLFPNMAATCWCSGLGGLRLLLVPGLCWSALEWKCLILELGFRLLTYFVWPEMHQFFVHIEVLFSVWLLVVVFLQSSWNGEFSAACSCDNYCSIGL